MSAEQVRTWFAAAGLAVGLVSCASAVESSKIEDGARRAVPVAICLKPLPRRGDKTIATMAPQDYWGLIFPAYDSGSETLDRAAVDCAGRSLLTGPELAQAEGQRMGPLKAAAADVSWGRGPTGSKSCGFVPIVFPMGPRGGPSRWCARARPTPRLRDRALPRRRGSVSLWFRAPRPRHLGDGDRRRVREHQGQPALRDELRRVPVVCRATSPERSIRARSRAIWASGRGGDGPIPADRDPGISRALDPPHRAGRGARLDPDRNS